MLAASTLDTVISGVNGSRIEAVQMQHAGIAASANRLSMAGWPNDEHLSGFLSQQDMAWEVQTSAYSDVHGLDWLIVTGVYGDCLVSGRAQQCEDVIDESTLFIVAAIIVAVIALTSTVCMKKKMKDANTRLRTITSERDQLQTDRDELRTQLSHSRGLGRMLQAVNNELRTMKWNDRLQTAEQKGHSDLK
eukprot:COSAG02_NODE_28923_length_579_cov_1.291667_1_plen_190_part_10